MGYAMSKLELDPNLRDNRQTSGGAHVRQRHDEDIDIDNEIFYLIRLRSEPSESTRKSTQGRRKMPISTVRMLSGREANGSGRGRFSLSDCSYVLGRYLPVSGPRSVDRMDTRAYVSQFSADGSLFVAGFQGSHIRIYDVDNGWKVRKDILAKNLRWTITDTSLSPNQRHLVYASLSPVVNIVNVGTSTKESYANVTDIHDGLDFSLHDDVDYSFNIFSVKFSSDGRELVAGSSDCSIYVYDLEANKLTSRIPAHSPERS